MPPERRMVAKKSAPSHYAAYPPHHASNPRRSSSPMSLEDQLLFIEKWGVNQLEACKECRYAGIKTGCFIAAKISPRCGNCLRAGKKCHFLEIIGSSDDEHESHHNDDNELSIEKESNVIIRRKDDSRAAVSPILAGSLVNYDTEDVDQSPRVVTLYSSPERGTMDLPHTKPSSPAKQKSPTRSRWASKIVSPQISPKSIPISRPNPSVPPRAITPPLAMPESNSNRSYSPISLDQMRPAPTSELSFTERRLVIMAIQEQVDWGAVARTSGVGVDKLMEWWAGASSDLVKRG